MQKNTEVLDSKVLKTKIGEQCYYQNVLYVALKSQDF